MILVENDSASYPSSSSVSQLALAVGFRTKGMSTAQGELGQSEVANLRVAWARAEAGSAVIENTYWMVTGNVLTGGWTQGYLCVLSNKCYQEFYRLY